MICKLFEHLGLKDLVACSMLNKRWYSIYATFKLHRLAVADYHPIFDKSEWCCSKQPIQAERCVWRTFDRLVEKPLLSNLKYLTLIGYQVEFDLNKLNRFRQLVRLEINTLLAGTMNLNLNLPRLRVLAIHHFNDCSVSIDCPELSMLAYYAGTNHANHLDVKQPETIRRLETNLVGQQLTPFKSVECLVTNEFDMISKAILFYLPRLRELHFEEDIERLVVDKFDMAVGTIDRMKRTVREFLYEAKKLRGSDFRFTFSGFQLTNLNVDQIDFSVQVNEDEEEEPICEWVSNEYIYLKNYHLIEPGALQFVHRVVYTRLLPHVTGEFPRCFSQKFTGIEEVQIDGLVKDPDHLLWFLKSLRSLRKLELKRAELSQEFYDQLPAAIRSLVILDLSPHSWKTGLQLNFDFISEFPSLSKLEIIYQPLFLKSVPSLVRSLGKLKCASICVRSGSSLWIKKVSDSTVWKIQPSKDALGSLFETKNPGELGIFFAGFEAAVSRKASN